jgi:hypothetical protein
MKYFMKGLLVLLLILYIAYLALPNQDYPNPPPHSLQSNEPADSENLDVRRAYFVNNNREEVVSYYQGQIDTSVFLGIPLPTYRLNYPPEESQTIIRDQTRSSYLEEIVHPFRESVFVNGFFPGSEKDTIHIEGKYWVQKVTVRYVSSGILARVIIGVLTIVLIVILLKEWVVSLRSIFTFNKNA